MKTPAALSHLPELPVEIFELGAKLEYSETAPVITNRPDIVTAPPPVVAPLQNRSSHQIITRYGWVIYPKVICHSFNDGVLTAALKLKNSTPDLRANVADLGAIAGARRYYKLTRFRGVESALLCEVRGGPWFAKVTETESCSDQIPDRWVLEAPDPGIALSWSGTWDDMPSVPHLIVVVDLNSIGSITIDCCPGFTYCPTTGGCLPDSVPCQDAHPA